MRKKTGPSGKLLLFSNTLTTKKLMIVEVRPTILMFGHASAVKRIYLLV